MNLNFDSMQNLVLTSLLKLSKFKLIKKYLFEEIKLIGKIHLRKL